MKKINKAMLVHTIIAILTLGSAALTQAGLVAHYKFDGDLTDSSGNELNGTAVGAITYEAGHSDQMAVFDGSSSITVPHNAKFDFGANNFSISMWLKIPDTAATQGILEKVAGSTGFSIPNLGGSKAGHLLIIDGGNTWQYGGYGVGYPANELHNVILIRDNAKWEGSIYLYHDGVECCAGTWKGDASSAGDLIIGDGTMSAAGLELPLIGAIDDLRIYDHALSPEERLAIVVPPPPPETPAPPQLVAHYKFDGDLKDSTTNHLDGVATGTITYEPGHDGQMAVFDGNSYITVLHNTNLNLGAYSGQNLALGNFTISMWLRVDDTAATQAILEKVANLTGFTIPNFAGGKAGHLLIQDGAGAWAYGGYGVGYPANELHNVILIRDNAKWAGSIYLYHDGVQCCAGSWTGDASSTGDLFIGHTERSLSPASGNLTGAIDDLRIYNYALSPEEISAIVTPPPPPPSSSPELVAHYKFDGDLTDSSGNGLNGTAAGSGAITYSAGQFGQKVNLPANAGIVVPDSSLLDFGAGDFSIAAWVQADNGGAAVMTIFEKAPGGPSNAGFKYRLQGSYGPAPALMVGNAGFGNNAYGPYPFRSRSIPEGGSTDYQVEYGYGSLHHLVMVRNNAVSPGRVDLWLDGVKWDGVNLVNGQTTQNFGGSFDHDCGSSAGGAIGFSPIDTGGTEAGAYLQGSLDDLRIYNYALSQAEIDALLTGLPTPPPHQLVAHYKFDGDLTDSTSNALNGVATGAITFEAGQIGQMAVFSGDSGVTVANDPLLNFGSDGFTVAMWLRVDSQTADQNLVEKTDGTAAGFRYRNQAGAGVTPAIDDGAGTLLGGPYGGKFSFGSLHHIAFVRRPAAPSGGLYIDGVLQNNYTADLNVSNSGDLKIGFATVIPGSGARLAIDDLRIYNFALNDAEVAALGPPPPPGPQLVAHYKFDGDLTDSTSNGFNGTASGTITFEPGQLGQMAVFSGDSGVTVANDPLLNFGSDGFTVAMWLRVDSQTADQNLVEKTGGTAAGFRYRNQAGAGVTPAIDDGAGTLLGGPYGNKFPFGSLHHIAFVRRPAAPSGGLYIDGVLQNNYTADLNVSNSGDLKIGFATVGPGTGARLAMDDLQIYNYALGDAEIAALIAPPPSPHQLVAHYKFDGDLTDSSGNGLDGTEVGTITFSTGQLDQMAEFDGNSGITVSTSPLLNFGKGDFSVALWLREDGDGKAPTFQMSVIEKGDESAKGYKIRNQGGAGATLGWWKGDNTGLNGPWGSLFPKSELHHVVFVRTSSDATVRTWIDGERRIAATGSGDVDINNTGNLTIGYSAFPARGSVDGNNLLGAIDDLRIYNYALSEDEIIEITGIALPPPEPQLVAHYRFDGNANDSSPNALHGTPTGTVTYQRGLFGQMAELSEDSGITVPHNRLLNFGAGAFAVALWLRVDSQTADQTIIEKTGGSAAGFRYRNQAGAGVTPAIDDGAGTLLAGPFGNKFPFGEFHHIVFLRRASAPSGGLFIDGVVQNNYTADLNVDNKGDLKIGFATVRPGSGARLAIDDLRVYNYELSEAEITALAVAPPPPPPPAQPQLVAHYKFDGDVTDSSTNGLNGTAVGTITFSPGHLGQMAQFDGGSGITVPNNPLLNVGLHDLSVAFWFLEVGDGLPPNYQMSILEKTDGGVVGFKIRNQGGLGATIGWWAGDNSNPNGPIGNLFPKAPALDASLNLHHVVFVRTEADKKVRYWIDGVLLERATVSGDYDINNNADMTIGFSAYPVPNSGDSDNLYGAIDDLRIYNYALSQDQIIEIYGEAPPPSCPDAGALVAHYKFDGDLKDSSGNGFDGTATGTITFEPGKFGSMAVFTDDSGVTVPHNPLFDFRFCPFTVALWLRVDSQTAGQTIIEKTDGSATGFSYRNVPGDGATLAIDDGAGTGLGGPFGGKFPFGELHHIVFSRRGGPPSSGGLYIDGVLQNNYTADLNVLNNGELNIGFATERPGDGPRLAIDELRIYNFELSEAEIFDLAKSLPPPPLPILPAAHTHQQNPAADGLLAIEAEHFVNNIPAGGTSWVYTNDVPGYSAEGFMVALPNSGGNVNIDISNSPRLDFRVHFVKTGLHHVWVRAFGDSAPGPSANDSVNVGLDGVLPETSDRISTFPAGAYAWSKTSMDSGAPATFEVTTPGDHVVNVWMREDGFIVDKILITANPDFTPVDLGPAESLRQPVEITDITDNGVAVSITWTGGTAPYLLQKKNSLTDAAWFNVLTTANQSVTVAKDGNTGFFRVQDQAQVTVTPFTVLLNGASERNTPVDSPASGSGALSLEGDKLAYSISYSGFAVAPIAGHIHGLAPATGTAGVRIPLTLPGGTAGTITGAATLDAELLAGLKSGQLYANLHTLAHQGGEIRGQIVPLQIPVTLQSADEAPPVAVPSTATGSGTLTMIGSQMLYHISYSGLTAPATAAHLHGPAAVGVAANPLVPLSGAAGTSGTLSGTASLDPGALANLLDGKTYVNIHTGNNPNGEIRGQIQIIP